MTPVAIPMQVGTQLSKEDCPLPGTPEMVEMGIVPYREVVGGLMYLACSTRADISHAVGEVARFVSNPGLAHWKAVKQICKYLIGTSDFGLHYDGKQSDIDQVYGFSDADWGNNIDNRRSKTGYTVFGFGGLLSWRSKLQACVSQSTLEAEYVAIRVRV